MTIIENLEKLRKDIPGHVQIVAVSKTQPPEMIEEAYRAGQRHFGENKARELEMKYNRLPADISWHFIGHLQRNKVRQIAPFVALIHSIDSLRLLAEVEKEAARCSRTIDCLLQFHIATEETKFGLSTREGVDLLASDEFRAMRHVRIRGVMGMASFSDDISLVRQEFRGLAATFRMLKERFFAEDNAFRILSMGMSGDYSMAIEEGSNMIRIGTSIFGDRHLEG